MTSDAGVYQAWQGDFQQQSNSIDFQILSRGLTNAL